MWPDRANCRRLGDVLEPAVTNFGPFFSEIQCGNFWATFNVETIGLLVAHTIIDVNSSHPNTFVRNKSCSNFQIL